MKSARLLILKAAFVVAILFAPLSFGAVYTWGYLGIAALIFSALLIYPGAVLESRHFPRFFLAGTIILFTYLLIQSFFVSQIPHVSQQQLLFWIALAAAFLLIQLLRRHAVLTLFFWIVLAALMEALYGFFLKAINHDQVLWMAKEFHQGFLTGSYFNRNHFAGLLELALGLHLGYLVSCVQKRRPVAGIFGVAVFFILVTALFASGSRTGLVSFALAFLLTVPLLRRMQITGTGLLWAFCFILLITAVWFGRDTLFHRFDALKEELDTWDGRLVVWKDTLGMILRHPLMGTGLGNYEWFFPAFQSDVLTWGWPHAHNDYLELTAELGIPACLLFLALIGGLLSWNLGHFENAADDHQPFIWGAMIAVLSLSFHGMTDFNFAIPANAFLFILVLAGSFRLVRGHQSKKNQKQTKTSVVWHTIIRIVALVLIFLSVPRAWAGIKQYQAKMYMLDGDIRPAIEKLEQSLDLAPNDPSALYALGEAAWKLGLQERKAAWIKYAEKHFERLTQIVPFYGRGWLYLGLSRLYLYRHQSASDRWKEALAHLQRAYELEPGSAWMAYTSSTAVLSFDPEIPEKERLAAWRSLRQSVEILPEQYLKPALQFVWNKYRDTEKLIEITPETFEAHKILIEFINARNVQKGIAAVYQLYFDYKNEAVEKLCFEGNYFYKQHEDRRALEVFEEAYWADPQALCAQAGRLAVRERLNSLPKDYRKQIETFLLNDHGATSSEDLNKLKEVSYLARDPLLMGLWTYRKGENEQAWSYFKNISMKDKENDLRRVWADVLFKTGRISEAKTVLRPIFSEEKPDIRDFLLWQNLEPDQKSETDLLIEQHSPPLRSFQAWWGPSSEQGLLDAKEKAGMVIQLRPGRQSIEFSLKRLDSLEAEALILIRLKDVYLGMISIPPGEDKSFSAEVETAGGRKWLEAEFLNGFQKENDLPMKVQLGDVKLE